MIALRKAANCESFDHSAEEIYLEHVKAICAAFAQADTAEAASRKLAVKTCWRAGGRVAEPSALNYNLMVWNVKFQCAAKAGATLPTLPSVSVLGKRPAAAASDSPGGKSSARASRSPDTEIMATRVMRMIMSSMTTITTMRATVMNDRGMGRCSLCHLRLGRS